MAGLGCDFGKSMKDEKVFYAGDDGAGGEFLWLTGGILAQRMCQLSPELEGDSDLQVWKNT